MEKKQLRDAIEETIIRMLNDELNENKKVNLGIFCEAIMSGTLSAIAIIVQVAGKDPEDIVKEIVAQTYKQVCTDQV